MNPYPKPPAGSYRQPLIDGLTLINRPIEAEMFRTGKVKLGISSSFTGAVRVAKQLTEFCIAALKAMPPNEITAYYLWQLEHGAVLPAMTDGAYVYHQDDPTAMAYVKAQGQQQYKPGELFFKS